MSRLCLLLVLGLRFLGVFFCLRDICGMEYFCLVLVFELCVGDFGLCGELCFRLVFC